MSYSTIQKKYSYQRMLCFLSRNFPGREIWKSKAEEGCFRFLPSVEMTLFLEREEERRRVGGAAAHSPSSIIIL